MHHQPDFERDQDRERREGFRGGRDEGRFEQRGQGRMEPDELRHHRGREREYGDEGYARSQPGGGQHQQYSQSYGGQGQYGGFQGGYGGPGQPSDYQERYGQQGGYGSQGQYGGFPERYDGGPGQFGGGFQGGYGGPGRFGGYPERYGQQGGYGPGRFGGYPERHGQQGGYRGKGPKDWTRSDERIREEVCELLADSDDVDASEITVKVENGEVMLEGFVDSRWTKREAEEIACRARGVKDCHNHLRVKSETTSMGKEKEAGNGHTQASRSPSSMSSRPTA